MCLAELATRVDVKYVTLKKRLNKGWTVEEAVTTPVRKVSPYLRNGRKCAEE